MATNSFFKITIFFTNDLCVYVAKNMRFTLRFKWIEDCLQDSYLLVIINRKCGSARWI